jgi:hypothetical protein
VFGNTTSVVVIDAATGREPSFERYQDAIEHGFTIDGPLNLVGAAGERALLLKSLPGRRANVLGAEGEILVSRRYGYERASGREEITGTLSGRDRETDFFSTDTIPDHDAVFEVKNKGYVFDERGGQVSDLADFATGAGADLWVFVRPGTRVAGTVSGLSNAVIMPIPQMPTIVRARGLSSHRSPARLREGLTQRPSDRA